MSDTELYTSLLNYDYRYSEEYAYGLYRIRLLPEGTVDMALEDGFDRWANSTIVSMPLPDFIHRFFDTCPL